MFRRRRVIRARTERFPLEKPASAGFFCGCPSLFGRPRSYTKSLRFSLNIAVRAPVATRHAFARRLSSLEDPMKRIVIAVASAFSIAPAFAQWDWPYYSSDRYNCNNTNQSQRQEYARVVDAQPLYAS